MKQGKGSRDIADMQETQTGVMKATAQQLFRRKQRNRRGSSYLGHFRARQTDLEAMIDS